MNRAQLEGLMNKAQERLEVIGDKENPSDKDQNMSDALETLVDAIQGVLDAMDG
jgi:hypothetical protein